MSTYRSGEARLARRVEELEEQLADLAAEERAPLVRERLVRDARVRFWLGVALVVLGTFGALWAGVLAGAPGAADPAPAAPITPSLEDQRATANANARRATCIRAVQAAEWKLHRCEVDLREAVDGGGVEVETVSRPEGFAIATEALAPYAPSVLTCHPGTTTVHLDFDAKGVLATRIEPGLTLDEEACVRAALAPAQGLADIQVSAVFRLPPR